MLRDSVILLLVAISTNGFAQDPVPTNNPDSGKVAAQAVFAAGPVERKLSITASLSERKLILREGDSTVANYDVAIGADEHATPTGTFSIRKIVWNPRWVPPDAAWARGKTSKDPGHPANPMKLVKIFFLEPDYYIHGTGDIASLGKAASHGCLRMDPDQAAVVAKWIMEHGGQPREENWFKRILHFRRQEHVVYLDNPVLLTITG